ncbi:MAG: hypothetical protein E7207_08830 [Clostridium butyricum]|nr:hypothetical protein [Clostridium butyricum]
MSKKHKNAFTIIESLIYIFMTIIILSEGLSLTVIIYKSYVENAEIVSEYNDMQNFNINFQNIILERDISKVTCSANEIKFSKYIDGMIKNKSMRYKASSKSIVVRTYDEWGKFLNENVILGNVSNMVVKEKGNLIYLIIYDKYGKEFISCL